jgi:hypothetical protein
MKTLLKMVLLVLIAISSVTHAADGYYTMMLAMEASLGNSKPVFVTVEDYSKTGEIGFGRMQDNMFVGHRIQFKSLGAGHTVVDVAIEEIGVPLVDATTGDISQSSTKKILRIEADGVSRSVEIGSKKISFRILKISAGDSSKMINLEEPQKE